MNNPFLLLTGQSDDEKCPESEDPGACLGCNIGKYCSGIALASWIGAISGTIPWSLMLITHVWVAAVYLVLVKRQSKNVELTDTDKPAGNSL